MTFPHTAAIHRMTEAGGKYTFGLSSSSKCFLQPLDAEKSQAYGITFSKGYHCYLPLTADITEKDRLIIDSVTYGVKGVRQHNYGTLSHIRATLERL